MQREVKASTVISIPLFLTIWFIPVQVAQAQFHHYQLVEIPPLKGGTTISFAEPDDSNAWLNNSGSVSGGGGDTSLMDPYSSAYHLTTSGVVLHAFLWQNGVTSDLGSLKTTPPCPFSPPAKCGNNSISYWISQNGTFIAGISENGATDPSVPGLPQLRAVIWNNSKIIDLGPSPGGGYQSAAASVNSAGQVTGVFTNLVPDNNSRQDTSFFLFGVPNYPFAMRAFAWDQEHGMQDLGTLGGKDAEPVKINELGQIVGFAYTGESAKFNSFPCPLTDSPTGIGAFIWDRTHGMVNLGSFGGTCTFANDINNVGQVVGGSHLVDYNVTRPFIWQNGSLQDLGGSLGGKITTANALNDAGVVVGLASLAGDKVIHAAEWKQVGQLTDLGTVGGDGCAFALAVNTPGQVVGLSADCAFTTTRGFLWENGSIADLNALIPPNSPLFIDNTFAINDQGEIAADAADANGDHAVVLIPCDANHPNIPGCDYSLVAPSIMTSAVRTAPVRRLPMPSLLGRRIRLGVGGAQPQN